MPPLIKKYNSWKGHHSFSFSYNFKTIRQSYEVMRTEFISFYCFPFLEEEISLIKDIKGNNFNSSDTVVLNNGQS